MRTAIYSVLALAVVALVGQSVLAIVLAAHAPSWVNWVCSHSTAHSIQHLLPQGKLGAAFKTSQRALEIHWPHLIPIPAGIATLIHLRRANARYVAQQRANIARGLTATQAS